MDASFLFSSVFFYFLLCFENLVCSVDVDCQKRLLDGSVKIGEQ